MNDQYYKTTRWKKLREKILRRDNYMCQEAKRYGKQIQADTVHHIFPREEFPEYQWQPWNLISLSHGAHEQMHIREDGDLTDAGRGLLRRIAKRQGIPVPERYATDEDDTRKRIAWERKEHIRKGASG